MSVDVITLGCRLNAAESETMRLLASAQDDLIIVNSCAVTNEAVRQTRQAIRKAKRARPQARVVVTGCAAQTLSDVRAELEAAAGNDVLFTGPLEHRHLVHLWPLCDVSVMPSVFPEAFGMVAAEAAACGCPPLVADHSGMAAVAAGIAAEYPAVHRELTSFGNGDVDDLAGKLATLLALPAPERRALSEAARRAAVALWSWENIAALLLSRGGRRPAT